LQPTYVWRLRSRLPERHGQPCRVTARAAAQPSAPKQVVAAETKSATKESGGTPSGQQGWIPLAGGLARPAKPWMTAL